MSGQRASGQVWAFARLPALIPCSTRQPRGQRALLRFARHYLKPLVAVGRATGNGHPLKGGWANCPPPRCGALTCDPGSPVNVILSHFRGMNGDSTMEQKIGTLQAPTLLKAIVGGYLHRQQPLTYSYLLHIVICNCHTTYHKQHIYTQVAG